MCKEINNTGCIRKYLIIDSIQNYKNELSHSSRKGKEGLGISTQGISLGFLIIEFHSESVVQLPKSSPLCVDVGVIKEIKDCGGIKYLRKKGQARRGDANSSRAGKRARRRDWHPVEGRKNSVEELSSATGQMRAYHLSVRICARSAPIVSRLL